jgi:WD40 repeat protein
MGSGGEIFSAGGDGKIIKWDAKNRNLQASYANPRSLIHRSLVKSKDKLYGGGNYNQILILDANAMAEQGKLNFPKPEEIRQVSFMGLANANQMVVVYEKYNPNEKFNIALWDLNTNQMIENVVLKDKIEAMAVKNNQIALATGNRVLLLNVIQGLKNQSEFPVKNQTQPIMALAFSNLGDKLATGDDKGDLKLYDFNSKIFKGTLPKGHKARVNAISFSRNDSQVASASFDGTIRIWELGTIKDETYDDTPITLEDHRLDKDYRQWVWAISFSEDGSRLIAGCRDNLLRSWYTNSEEMAQIICQDLNQKNRKDLTDKQWERFVGTTLPKEITVKNNCQKK